MTDTPLSEDFAAGSTVLFALSPVLALLALIIATSSKVTDVNLALILFKTAYSAAQKHHASPALPHTSMLEILATPARVQ